MRPIQTPQSNVALTMPGDQPPIPAERILFWDSSQGDTRDDARPGFVTRWMPTEEEAARLEAGACIELTIVGNAHPEVRVQVGRAVLPEAEIIARGHVDRALGLLYATLCELVTTTPEALEAIGDDPIQHVRRDYLATLGIPTPAEFADLWTKAVTETTGTLA